jgi:YD repeat-containing protein
VTYYYYDGFGRLKWIKDQDGNIIKTFQYHYLGKTTIY